MGGVASGMGFGGLSDGEAGFGIATGGMFAGTVEANKSRQLAEKQAKDAKTREAQRQAKIDENMRRVREMFGVDPWDLPDKEPGQFTEAAPEQFITQTVRGPVARGRRTRSSSVQRQVENPAYTQWKRRKSAHDAQVKDYQDRFSGNELARENKAKMESWLDEYGDAVNEANTIDLNDQFTAASTSNRWALADRGLLGGSVDAGSQRQTISELVAGRQKAYSAGLDAKRQAQGQLLTHRLNLENQVAAGTNLNMDFQALQDQTKMGLDTVRSQIVPTAVGNTFSTVGGAVGRQQASRGGTQTSASHDIAGSSSGRITR